MRRIDLAGTNIDTTIIGLGCAGLFHLPRKEERRAAIEAAFDAGIRHFDVAPMYGLSLAETELAPLLKRHRNEITVTTKFGIDVTVAGRTIGRMQGPVRRLLARTPKIRGELKTAGSGPKAGMMGRILYAPTGYSVQAATSSLYRSLRALGTDYVDVFALHDPPDDLGVDIRELIAYLDHQCDIGRIRCWGIAGDAHNFRGAALELANQAPLVQLRDNAFDPCLAEDQHPTKARITYGILVGALPAIERYFDEFPDQCGPWSDRFEMDVRAEACIPTLLLREALRRNAAGPVLMSSTKVGRIRDAARVATESGNLSIEREAAALHGLVATVRSIYPELRRS